MEALRVLSGTAHLKKSTQSDLFLCERHGYMINKDLLSIYVGREVVPACRKCWEHAHSFQMEADPIERKVELASLKLDKCAREGCTNKVIPWERTINTCGRCRQVYCTAHMASTGSCTDCNDIDWLEDSISEDEDGHTLECNHPGCEIHKMDTTIILNWCVECEMYYCDQHAAVKLDCCAHCEKVAYNGN
jgi:hypothetical protein